MLARCAPLCVSCTPFNHTTTLYPPTFRSKQLARVCDFLGIVCAPESLHLPAHNEDPSKKEGVSANERARDWGTGERAQDLEEQLRAFYAPFNARLGTLLGMEFSWQA